MRKGVETTNHFFITIESGGIINPPSKSENSEANTEHKPAQQGGRQQLLLRPRATNP
jgi:hypothetical protein